MTNARMSASKATLISCLAVVALPMAASAADLSRYRNVQLGMDLPTVARQVGASPSQATVAHRRPALIQELEWSPRILGPSLETEPAQEVLFTFYNGELFRIVVNYDQYETEGLTADDMVEAISSIYGTGVRPTPAKAAPEPWVDQQDVVARWQDPQYRFELIRTSYGPRYRLVGVLRTLEATAQAAIMEATQLDDKEAPERDAAQAVREEQAERARLEKTRLVNKGNFRP